MQSEPFPFPRTLRLYALLLRLYPARCRREFAEPMLQLFRDQCRDAARAQGGAALPGIWRRMLKDLFASLLREHTTSLIETMNALTAPRYSLLLLVSAVLIAFLANPALIGPAAASICVYLATFLLVARLVVELYRPRNGWWKGIAWGVVTFVAFGFVIPFWAKSQAMFGAPLPLYPPLHAIVAILNLAVPLVKPLFGFNYRPTA